MMITEESISTHPPSGVLARNVKESRNCNKASLSNLDSNVELKGNIENEVTLEDIVPWILVWNLIQKIMLIAEDNLHRSRCCDGKSDFKGFSRIISSFMLVAFISKCT
ncbi:hypothetical protein L195_g034434 [Trifolium pratense]|uniref:Uncharacterized protein n=1 Tax=Trifolium pratense TaxID=57577 RepID=A0A2K3LIV6_TRIPR|nr:hypothetical protein L195_g034434 [Trifolium pratense]